MSILALLHPVQCKNHPDKVSNRQEDKRDLNTSEIKYLVDIKDIGKFEHQNNISIRAFGCEDKKVLALRITTTADPRHHVNL